MIWICSVVDFAVYAKNCIKLDSFEVFSFEYLAEEIMVVVVEKKNEGRIHLSNMFGCTSHIGK